MINNNPDRIVIINPTNENPKKLRAVRLIKSLFICTCAMKLLFNLMNGKNIFFDCYCYIL